MRQFVSFLTVLRIILNNTDAISSIKNNQIICKLCTHNRSNIYFCCTVNCGTLGKAEKCQKCPRLYGKESCTGGDCGYLNDTCVRKGTFLDSNFLVSSYNFIPNSS